MRSTENFSPRPPTVGPTPVSPRINWTETGRSVPIFLQPWSSTELQQLLSACARSARSYILPNDLHSCCETFLGLEHAGLALTPGVKCYYCKDLPEHEKRRRVDFFSNFARDEGWTKPSNFSTSEVRSQPTPLPRHKMLIIHLQLSSSSRRGLSFPTTHQGDTCPGPIVHMW